MPRRKLTRFKAKRPSDEWIEAYGLLYSKGFVYTHPDKITPLTSQALFANDNPLILDLGSGRGEFTHAQAVKNPHINYVGIDMHLKSLYVSINRVGKSQLDNIKFIMIDILNALQRVESCSVQELFLLFPPPVLKEKYLHKDVMTQRFISEVYRGLKEGGAVPFCNRY